MKKRTIVGLCGAVALAAVSTTASAIMMVDTADRRSQTLGTRSVNFAKETLRKDEVTEVDGATYYDIERDQFVSGPADIEAVASNEYYVSFVLNGMVFQGR